MSVGVRGSLAEFPTTGDRFGAVGCVCGCGRRGAMLAEGVATMALEAMLGGTCVAVDSEGETSTIAAGAYPEGADAEIVGDGLVADRVDSRA